ncbi:MAG: diguanylate cyclase (GGDEF)-like protein [Rhodococcus sp. (in: high G+C Gram-positive bacteria)]|jgi:diguanylate cyclase (GGDEF)-like protein
MHLIRRWWTHPTDYARTAAYHRVDPLLRHAHYAVGAWCLLYSILCVLLTFTPAGLPDGVGRTFALVLAVVAAVVGGMWIRGPWPDEKWSRAFVAFLEISVAATLLLLADPLVALPCAAALGVCGSYIGTFHGQKLFVLHQFWSVLIVGTLFVLAIGRPDTDFVLASLYAIVVALVLFSGPVLTQALLLLLRGDAVSSFYDPLTGLHNRRGLDAAVAEGDKAGKTVTVMVVDLDNFKLVNDRFGHAHGDIVLRDIAATINEFFVPPAVTARTGGEEFVIVTPEDPVRAIERAHALRVRLASHDGTSATVSIGMCHTDGAVLSEIGIEDACNRADAAMYTAKQSGGNAVHVDAGHS